MTKIRLSDENRGGWRIKQIRLGRNGFCKEKKECQMRKGGRSSGVAVSGVNGLSRLTLIVPLFRLVWFWLGSLNGVHSVELLQLFVCYEEYDIPRSHSQPSWNKAFV